MGASPKLTRDRAELRQIRQFSAFLLLCLLVGTALTISYLAETAGYWRETAVDHAVSVAVLILLLSTFVVNRRGYYQLAVAVTISAIFLAIFLSAVPTASQAEVTMLYYLVVPIVVSGFAMSVRFTAAVGAVAVAGTVAFPFVTQVPNAVVPLGNIVLVASFVTVAAYGRMLVDRERRGQLVEQQRRLERQATHDELTGLPNRLLFRDRIAHAISRYERHGTGFCVVFVDLDNFKAVNDAVSHTFGDSVLRIVGERLQEAVRRSDTVSRRSGDEFILLLEGASEREECVGALRKVRDAFAEPFEIEGREVYVSASLGISRCPADAVGAEELIRKADTAVYAAKRSGKDIYVFFAPDMNKEADDRISLVSDLRRAISHRELETYYQPQIDAATGRVIGVESLLRWHHPRRGWVSPAVFVHAAEESGAISDLTRLVMQNAERVLEDSASENGSGPLRVAVNLSHRDLHRGDLFDLVGRLVSSYGVPADRIELELTENIVFGESQRLGGLLRRLKEFGVRIAIDDFGAGYATLRHITDFPIDTLKIDRSFTTSIAKSDRDRAAVAGIAEMARRLGIELIAEGVESVEQVRAYEDLGCHIFQGWYYAPAQNWEETRRYIESNS